jgi:CubicO group peptidase (beta-lactamase class C family)
VISHVSGRSYASYLEKEIFKPLGMSQTTTKAEELKMIVPGHYPSIRSVIVCEKGA